LDPPEARFSNAKAEGLNHCIKELNSFGRGVSFDVLRDKTMFSEISVLPRKKSLKQDKLDALQRSIVKYMEPYEHDYYIAPVKNYLSLINPTSIRYATARISEIHATTGEEIVDYLIGLSIKASTLHKRILNDDIDGIDINEENKCISKIALLLSSFSAPITLFDSLKCVYDSDTWAIPVYDHVSRKSLSRRKVKQLMLQDIDLMNKYEFIPTYILDEPDSGYWNEPVELSAI